MTRRRKSWLKKKFYFWTTYDKTGFCFGPKSADKTEWTWEFSTRSDEDFRYFEFVIDERGISLEYYGFCVFQARWWKYWTLLGFSVYKNA